MKTPHIVSRSDSGKKIYRCPECEFESDSRQGLSLHCRQNNGHEDVMKLTLISELQVLAEKLGRTPTSDEISDYDIAGVTSYQRHFGSWNNAIEETGLEVNATHSISKDELVNELKNVAEKIDKTPTKEEMTCNGKYNAETYVSRFGSWQQAVTEAELTPNRYTDVSEDEIIAQIQEIADETGGTPTREKFRKHSEVTVSAVTANFGTWNKAIEAAGLSPNVRHSVSEEELLQHLIELADRIGRPPSSKDMTMRGDLGTTVYYEQFGSWSNALRQAGYEPIKRRNIPDEELLNDLQKVATELSDRKVTIESYKNKGKYAWSVFARRFGSWNDALKEAELEVNSEYDIAPSRVREDLQRVAAEIDQSLTRDLYDEHGQFSSATVRKQFGSWKDALNEIGEETKINYDISNRDLIEDLRDVADKTHDSPTRQEYEKYGCFGAHQLARRFGSWDSALEEAGLTPHGNGYVYRNPDHLDHIVRSRWELVIAELLIEAGVEYQYESLKIEYPDGIYIPDFVTDEYVIEVKGHQFADRDEVEKANAALNSLTNLEYVVIGTELPADYHFTWEKRYELQELLM